jgi:hypothetical protein
MMLPFHHKAHFPMKYVFTFFVLLLPLLTQAQFKPTENGLTVIVTDGTFVGTDSPAQPPGEGEFTDPIRALGMMDPIQAGAFTERPLYGKVGFLLVFCVNDSIGGAQGTLTIYGRTYKGIYRLIRQKISKDEKIPEGMTTYRLKGTVYFLGIS